MKLWRVVLFASVFAAGVGIVSGRALWSRSSKLAPDPNVSSLLHVPVERLDFAEVWESDRFEWSLPVENRGEYPVAVMGIAGSCQCTTVQPQQFTLRAGERIDVRVVIDLRERSKGKVDARPRNFSVTLMPLVKLEPGEKQSPTEWTIKGRIRPLLNSSAEVYLGTHSELQPKLFPRSMVVESFVALQSLNAAITSEGVEVLVHREPAHANRYRIDLRTKPGTTFALGDFASVLTLRPVSADLGELPATSILLNGRILPDIQADPSEVLMPSRTVHDTVEEVVSLKSLTGTPFKIEGYRTTGEGIAVEPTGEAKSYRVKVTYRKPGAHEGSAAFHLRTENGFQQVVVGISGNAVDANPSGTVEKEVLK